MDAANITSREKLDRLLDEGRITQEDYERLARAVETRDERPGDGPVETGKRPPLRKSWEHRKLGGVCAGLAEHLDLDLVIVRVAAVIVGIIAPPITLLVYIVLSFLLPWDEPDKAAGSGLKARPWWFAGLGLFLFIILPMAICTYWIPKLAVIYGELSAELPSITIITIQVSSAYMNVLGLAGLLFMLALITGIYLVCHNKLARTALWVAMLVFGIAWNLLLLLGSYWGLVNMPTLIQQA